MCNYRELLLTLIGGAIEDKYGVQVIEIFSGETLRADKDDPDFVDFSMTVKMVDNSDYNARVYRVKGFLSYMDRDITVVTRKFLADCL